MEAAALAEVDVPVVEKSYYAVAVSDLETVVVAVAARIAESSVAERDADLADYVDE